MVISILLSISRHRRLAFHMYLQGSPLTQVMAMLLDRLNKCIPLHQTMAPHKHLAFHHRTLKDKPTHGPSKPTNQITALHMHRLIRLPKTLGPRRHRTSRTRHRLQQP